MAQNTHTTLDIYVVVYAHIVILYFDIYWAYIYIEKKHSHYILLAHFLSDDDKEEVQRLYEAKRIYEVNEEGSKRRRRRNALLKKGAFKTTKEAETSTEHTERRTS